MAKFTGVSYELFVQSFCDSNKDGIGDLPGIIQKLDYLAELGIRRIWLMPIHPSPSYHKYDVTDYYSIHPDYGTLDDFKKLIHEAHSRSIQVIMDLVINHCSRLHPWFTSALNPSSPFRHYFIWATRREIEATGSMTKAKTSDSDNILQWNPVPGQDELYFSYFWSGMPDLNFDHPAVRKEVIRIGKFWLTETGVDGFRLDAAKHLYPDHRAADTQAFWRHFQQEMKQCNPDVYLVGEVWSALEEQVPYAHGFSALFNFDLGYSILETVKQGHITRASVTEDRWQLQTGSPVSLYLQADQAFTSINPDFVQATFLSNHDQIRVRTFLKNHQGKTRLAAAILLTLPGAPFLYYGEEIGMTGRKPDIHLREPFPWGDEHDTTHWTEVTYNTAQNIRDASEQIGQSHSLLQHYHSLIRLRNHSPALREGSLTAVELDDPELLAFVREKDTESLLIIHNLSRQAKPFPKNREDRLYFTTAKHLQQTPDRIILPPYQTLILSINSNSSL